MGGLGEKVKMRSQVGILFHGPVAGELVGWGVMQLTTLAALWYLDGKSL